MLSPWLVFIERTEPASVSDGAGVDMLVREIEQSAAAAQGEARAGDGGAQLQPPLLDAIFIRLHILDHLHRPTLETFDKRIPVFATAQAAPTIRAWGIFDTVVETRDYKRTFFEDNVGHEDHAAGGAGPPERLDKMECLALFAGFKDNYSFGMRTTVGVERSLQLERKLEPRYWVRSHDSPLRYSGAVMRLRMTTDVIRTLEYGLEEERKEVLKWGKVDDLRRPSLVEVGNGKCFVLH
ncbi:hypothetical protein UCDDA912_g01018 [Diaporthe ampelina]|uniref:Uncharacterized protein n=1 Tax=Diaporthe ampelina TaxID=1214573 RepID=A0A0G2FY52_9PEZI|nr:hypothetical protein UCDDA912_g01018 [Diaporthe ampelina]